MTNIRSLDEFSCGSSDRGLDLRTKAGKNIGAPKYGRLGEMKLEHCTKGEG